MSFVKDSLVKNEQVLYETRTHKAIYNRGLIILSIGVIYCIYMFVTGRYQIVLDEFGWFGKFVFGAPLSFLLFGFIHIVGAWFNRRFTEMAITNKRIIIKRGYFDVYSFELLHKDIRGVDFFQGGWGDFFGYGTVIVNGSGRNRVPFRFMENPTDFKKRVLEIIT